MESLTTIDIGIQVEINNNNDLLIQIETLKNSYNTLIADYAKQVQIIEIKSNKIFKLEQPLANEKNKLESENKYLKEQWNEKYNT
ncbi:hypothetical protein F8M41_025833 [Gigaspora margarita]|uniref:Uncharacterized protein n=1 Tax=Gigaspora margarita TaxID=4874 RepID=A0A8H3XI19_GIGMA|nr:hypothetical protein F8M41_025833 [Gigaspora margarita]